MTVKEKLLQFFLIDNGMFPQQAERVFQYALPKLAPDDYNVTWNRPASDYPDAMYAVWGMTLKPIALEWIDANIPQAWFRPMFTPNPQEEIARLQALPERDVA